MTNADDVLAYAQSIRILGGELTRETVQEICEIIERGEMKLEEMQELVASICDVRVLGGQITPDVFRELLQMALYVRCAQRSPKRPRNAGLTQSTAAE